MGIGKGNGRGGARANAGRKTLDGAVVVGEVTAYLDQASLDVIDELGGGSIGVRRAFAELLFYRKGGYTPRASAQAPAVTKILQSTAKPRRTLNVPTQEEDDLPIDPRALYSDD